MPRGKKGKELGSRSRTTRKNASRVTRGTGNKGLDNSATASAPPYRTRSGLRSRPSVGSALSIRNDPESILREARKARKAKKTAQAQGRPESQTRGQLPGIAKSIETPLGEGDRRINNSAFDEYSDEDTILSSQDTDPKQAFYRKWGYLPPLDEEAAAIIDAIIANPDMGKDFKRIGADNVHFLEGLEFRNVDLDESPAPDPHADYIRGVAPEDTVLETEGEKTSHGQLWISDQAKCNQGSNEALFQRTFMMSLIARHLFIYERNPTIQHCLDFSFEEPWSCHPMPTRAYSKRTSFLSQPKPDLTVCFRRRAVIPNYLWYNMPSATKLLACFENIGDIGITKVFHFFTIEAKKGLTSAHDEKGKRQSLNNASQALHNMFEFFRDAGQQHETTFFEKVRFFSVVASTEGLTIRIHRATREPEDRREDGLIIPEYPLRFEYKELSRFQRENLDRETVLKTFENILIGYGAKELSSLLRNAAKSIMEKLDTDPEGMVDRQNEDFYRYGQTQVWQESKQPTPAAGRDQSKQNNTSSHIQQSRLATEAPSRAPSETNAATPVQSRIQTLRQASNKSKKRRRGQSADSEPARRTRQERQKTH